MPLPLVNIVARFLSSSLITFYISQFWRLALSLNHPISTQMQIAEPQCVWGRDHPVIHTNYDGNLGWLIEASMSRPTSNDRGFSVATTSRPSAPAFSIPGLERNKCHVAFVTIQLMHHHLNRLVIGLMYNWWWGDALNVIGRNETMSVWCPWSACLVFSPLNSLVEEPARLRHRRWSGGLCSILEVPKNMPCEAGSSLLPIYNSIVMTRGHLDLIACFPVRSYPFSSSSQWQKSINRRYTLLV